MYNRRVEDKLKSDHREVPEDNNEAIRQIWYALIGTNGTGLFKQFQSLKEHVEEHLVTKEACEAYHQKEKDRAVKIERIIFIVLGVLAFFFGDNIIGALSRLL